MSVSVEGLWCYMQPQVRQGTDGPAVRPYLSWAGLAVPSEMSWPDAFLRFNRQNGFWTQAKCLHNFSYVTILVTKNNI